MAPTSSSDPQEPDINDKRVLTGTYVFEPGATIKEPFGFSKWVHWNLIFSDSLDTFLADTDVTHPDFDLSIVEQVAKTTWPGNYKLCARLSPETFRVQLYAVFERPEDETWCRLLWKQK